MDIDLKRLSAFKMFSFKLLCFHITSNINHQLGQLLISKHKWISFFQIYLILCLNIKQAAGEMAHSLRTPYSLEGLGLIPSTYIRPLTTAYNSILRRSSDFFWLSQVLIHIVDTHAKNKSLGITLNIKQIIMF